METYEIDGFAIYEFKPQKENIVQERFENKFIFFAHANGVPAQTYRTLFQKIVRELNVNIITYDIRGMGDTKVPMFIDSKSWTWDILVKDHVFLFEKLQQKKTDATEWILAGHSLGAWISLFSSEKTGITSLLLFDPPILPFQNIIMWNLLCLTRRRELNPNSKKVKKRKRNYVSFDHAYESLMRSEFLRNWPKEVLWDYLKSSFAQKDSEIALKHDPLWEAHLFESYISSAARGFLMIPYFIRKKIKPIFFVGGKSLVCNPKSKNWVKLFLPNLEWVLIENSGHMFPLEDQEKILLKLKDYI